MRIRALRNFGAGLPPLKEGEEADIDDRVAEPIVKSGIAVQVACETPCEIHAVPAVAEFNTAPVIEVAPIIAEVGAVEVEPTEENTAPEVVPTAADQPEDKDERPSRTRGNARR